MDFDPAINSRFESEIARYNEWREGLTRQNDYHDWLEKTNQLDVQQSIRFFTICSKRSIVADCNWRFWPSFRAANRN